MIKAVALVFPHQLFKHHLQVKQSRPVYLVEETLFFNQYNFNKKKLVLHRASMKFYEDELSAKKEALRSKVEKKLIKGKLLPQK